MTAHEPLFRPIAGDCGGLPHAPSSPRSEARSGYRVFRSERDGFEVALAERLLLRLVRRGKESAPNEWYGVLMGVRYEDAAGAHAVVHAVVFDHGAVTSPGGFHTTPESEAKVRQVAREQFPDLEILGPVHGHCDAGVRYSVPDLEHQATWRSTEAVGAVVDPWSAETVGVYRGPGSEPLVPVCPAIGKPVPSAARRRSVCWPPTQPTGRREGPSTERAATPRRARIVRAAIGILGIVSAAALGLLWDRVLTIEKLEREQARVRADQARRDAARDEELAMLGARLDLVEGACSEP